MQLFLDESCPKVRTITAVTFPGSVVDTTRAGGAKRQRMLKHFRSLPNSSCAAVVCQSELKLQFTASSDAHECLDGFSDYRFSELAVERLKMKVEEGLWLPSGHWRLC